MTGALMELVWLSTLAMGQGGLQPYEGRVPLVVPSGSCVAASAAPAGAAVVGVVPGRPAGVYYPLVTTSYPPGTIAPTILPPSRPLAAPPASVSALPAVPAPVASGVPATFVYRPLLPVVPVPVDYYLGRGILGQPTVYVPGQPVRNFLRYLAP
jgi:hypothetical protein